jgi:hypothetical protein
VSKTSRSTSQFSGMLRLLFPHATTQPHFLPLDPCDSRLYSESMAKPNKKGKALMLGVGLDSDGHKRITTGENFALVGGTEETHEVMTEKVIRINEKLKSRGKQLETITGKEFNDIAEEVGLRKVQPKKR